MRKQLGLGSAVGALMGVRCWSGNRTLHIVSTFPDLATFILLVMLLGAALWFERRQRPVFDRAAAMQAALTIAAAAGVIFGVAVVLLGTRLLTDPSFVLLASGFLTALGTSVVCGALLALASTKRRLTRAD